MLWLKIAGGCVVNLGFNQLTTIPFTVASGHIQPTLVNVGPFRNTCFYNVLTSHPARVLMLLFHSGNQKGCFSLWLY